ncbi:hypothetical protein F0L68_27805 [Solihabitans fulvus]|uniref:Uncharacterized protein n=1 Tax=Solihabitans fulvus TaxID=1892852 RepID=A0A5B2X0Q2_9PSEU|nr:hypothetical protein [Solihabitans fulvus]KAA2255987.1 hypothetical protein F0L68_27805 [Solihabitans fulvus]
MHGIDAIAVLLGETRATAGTPSLWMFLLIGVGLLCAELRLRETGRSASPSLWVPGLFLADLVAGTVLLLFAAGPLEAPLRSLASASTVLLVVLGLVLGLAGLANLGLGAAVAYGFFHVDPTLAAWLATPIVVGAGLRLATTLPGSLGRFAPRDGDLVEPPGLADGLWALAGRAVALIPLAGVLLVPMPGGGPDPTLRVGGALLVGAQLLMYEGARGPLTRVNRRAARTRDVCLVLLLTVVAAGPAGELATAWWASIPALTGWSAGRFLLAAGAIGLALVPVLRRGGGTGVRLVFGVVRLALLGLLVPFFLGGVFHPAHGPLAAATVGAAVGAIVLLGNQSGIRAARQSADAASLLTLEDRARRRVLGWWVADAFLRRPARPDYSLVRRLNAVAQRCAEAATRPSGLRVRLSSGQRVELTSAHAAPLLAVEATALDLVDELAVPRHPPEHRPRIEFAQRAARADLAATRARVAQDLGDRDGALAAGEEAIERFRALETASAEVAARVDAAGFARSLGRIDEAERMLAGIREPKRIPPVMRRYLLVARALLKQDRGDTEAAGELLREARQISDRSVSAFRAALAADRLAVTARPGDLLRRMVALEAVLDRAAPGTDGPRRPAG